MLYVDYDYCIFYFICFMFSIDVILYMLSYNIYSLLYFVPYIFYVILQIVYVILCIICCFIVYVYIIHYYLYVICSFLCSRGLSLSRLHFQTDLRFSGGISTKGLSTFQWLFQRFSTCIGPFVYRGFLPVYGLSWLFQRFSVV